MRTFALSLIAVALSTTIASAQSLEQTLRDTTVSTTLVSGPLDFNLEGSRDGVSEFEVGFTTLEHSYGITDAELRFALGTYLQQEDSLYGRVEYNFDTHVTSQFVVYGTAALQYTTNTNLGSGLWTLDPSLGMTHAITDDVSVFGEVGYTWELNRDRRDLGGYVELGLPVAVTENFSVTPSVSRTFRTDANTTSAHLNFTYRF